MSKYSITATKKDYQFAFKTLMSLENQLGEKLDWKKIKRVSLDELTTIIAVLKRKLPAKSVNENDDVFIGRRGHAIDFFDEHQEELIKYAKTKGMISKENADKRIKMHDKFVEVLKEITLWGKSDVFSFTYSTSKEKLEEFKELLKQAEGK